MSYTHSCPYTVIVQYVAIVCLVFPSGVESLFNKTGCDSTTITDMLGGQSGVANSNVLQYMGIIEQRANELLQLNAFVQAKESDDPAAMATFLQGRAPKHTQGPLSVQPPSSKWVCLLASVHMPMVDVMCPRNITACNYACDCT